MEWVGRKTSKGDRDANIHPSCIQENTHTLTHKPKRQNTKIVLNEEELDNEELKEEKPLQFSFNLPCSSPSIDLFLFFIAVVVVVVVVVTVLSSGVCLFFFLSLALCTFHRSSGRMLPAFSAPELDTAMSTLGLSSAHTASAS